LITLIKYFIPVFYCIYLYAKILNIKNISLLKRLISILSSLFISFIIISTNKFIPQFGDLLILLLSIICTYILYKTEPISLYLSCIATLISFCISYAFFSITLLFSFATSYSIFDVFYSELFILLITFIIQGFLSFFIFKIKRLKNGISFLSRKGFSNTGILICVLFLLCVLSISNHNKADRYSILLFFTVIICCISILFWWRTGLKKSYIEDLRKKEFETSQNQILEKERIIAELIDNNDHLSSLIHKDNKIIPALEFAVRDFLSDSENIPSHLQKKGTEILKQIKFVSKKRKGLITIYQNDHKKLPTTGVFSIDNLLQYMFHRAKENGIQFDLILTGNIRFFAKSILDENDTVLILAELIDNSILSLEQCTYKKILITMGLVGDFYEISVSDSGTPFEMEIISSIGKKRVTSRASAGGSGTGLYTIFQILRNIHASFSIEESPEEPFSTNKKLTVCFDKKNETRIKSHRISDIRLRCNRSDIIFESNDFLS